MSSHAYRLLGFAVWHGGKWYLRQRMPSRRALLLRGLSGAGAITAGAFLVRRASA
jgi:hypothetical protein